MRAAGYIRVSTEDQVKHGWNLDADRERIQAIAADKGWEVDIYDDGGRQGDDPDRPGFNAMLERLDRYDVIILRSLDRLSRDTFLFALATRAIRQAGVEVHTFNGPVDLVTPEGELGANILAAIGRFEKAQIRVRVKQAKQARAQAGKPPGGKHPYGYRYSEGALVVDPTEAAVVRRMFEMAEATSQRQIARILNAEGIPASKGGKWVQGVVARVLGSPLYIGQIRRRTPEGGWEWHEGQHDAIVDLDLWQRVNASRATPERRVGGRPMLSGHLLTRGMLRCGSCGSAMIPVASYEGRPETYKCIGRRDHGPDFCRQPQVRREVIDEALLGQLTARYFDLDATRDRLRDRLATELPAAQANAEQREHDVAAVEARIAKVTRGWQDEVISDDEYKRQRAELDEERQAAQNAVTQAQARVEQIRASGAATDAEEALLRHLADLQRLVTGTVSQARDTEALRTVIRQLFETVELCEAGFGPLWAHHAEGVLTGDAGSVARAGTYSLVLRMRDSAVDWDAVAPTRPPMPEELTASTCR